MVITNPIRAVLLGAGPLGINIYKHALQRNDIEITHVIDINPALKGRDMGVHSAVNDTGVMIADALPADESIDVAILATVSDLPASARKSCHSLKLVYQSSRLVKNYPTHGRTVKNGQTGLTRQQKKKM